jgi:hypothetical protein
LVGASQATKYAVTKPITWASEMKVTLTITPASSFDSEQTGDSEKRESETTSRRRRVLQALPRANSNAILGRFLDGLLDQFDAKCSEVAKVHRLNANQTTQLNPLPLNPNKMQLAGNKTLLF